MSYSKSQFFSIPEEHGSPKSCQRNDPDLCKPECTGKKPLPKTTDLNVKSDNVAMKIPPLSKHFLPSPTDYSDLSEFEFRFFTGDLPENVQQRAAESWSKSRVSNVSDIVLENERHKSPEESIIKNGSHLNQFLADATECYGSLNEVKLDLSLHALPQLPSDRFVDYLDLFEHQDNSTRRHLNGEQLFVLSEVPLTKLDELVFEKVLGLLVITEKSHKRMHFLPVNLCGSFLVTCTASEKLNMLGFGMANCTLDGAKYSNLISRMIPPKDASIQLVLFDRKVFLELNQAKKQVPFHIGCNTIPN